ncbi:hypothetical protein [Leekyejoonella antrihumi]|uniref:Conjugal transfer protein n=1 Tax=Leekyejoonella antrihumi TaxID=1660198 RepID=A0A563DSA5_9MICO|nr:hypothetical protein [Leekyejoonella antrihumi]TWP33137.1 hypothetical protein FGL98_22335 [Leekyejoonella antrihumi]
MKRTRYVDPRPTTWEIPAGTLVGVVLVWALGIQLGRAVANLLAGGGATFPTRVHLFDSLPGVLSGNAAAGLSGSAAAIAGPGLLRVCLVIVELVLTTLMVGAAVWGWRRWGPGRVRGVASRADAERLLGRTRLRKNATMIRPDLHDHTTAITAKGKRR